MERGQQSEEMARSSTHFLRGYAVKSSDAIECLGELPRFCVLACSKHLQVVVLVMVCLTLPVMKMKTTYLQSLRTLRYHNFAVSSSSMEIVRLIENMNGQMCVAQLLQVLLFSSTSKCANAIAGSRSTNISSL